MKLDYSGFEYDVVGIGSPKYREIYAAQNIEKHMKKHPNEKVILQCDYGHVYEGRDESCIIDTYRTKF